MALELYLDMKSQPCRSVYIFAKKNNIPFVFKKVSLLKGEHFGEEFKKITPIKKVPAMRDGDFCLAESIAIMQYLAQKFQTPEFWYPTELRQRALVTEYLSWQHMGIRLNGSKIFWLRLLVPKMLGAEVPQEKMDLALKELNGSLKLLEEKFIQDKPFIVGDNMTLADLVAIVEVIQPVFSGLDVFKERPKLRAWRDRVQAFIGKELFDEAHEDIMNVQEKSAMLDASALELWKPMIFSLIM
ncbi:glutathione S-transferase theta-1b [Cynoglossus semilaevis]|uniref:glutathione transferase n=1 Tax=Cynoglossus semilaevis TaxID=244447 RepID=A0A3P8W966_CYNSE|nr:glutathione S-transferase theta-3-like [Cynoglossus semilaevis]